MVYRLWLIDFPRSQAPAWERTAAKLCFAAVQLMRAAFVGPSHLESAMQIAKPATNRVRLRERIRERCKDLTPQGVLAALYSVYGWACFKGTAVMLIFGHHLIPSAPMLMPPTQLRGWLFVLIALACWLVASATGVFVGWHLGKGVEFIAETRPKWAYPVLISSVTLPFAIVFVPVLILPGDRKLAMGIMGLSTAIVLAGLVCFVFYCKGWPERAPRG